METISFFVFVIAVILVSLTVTWKLWKGRDLTFLPEAPNIPWLGVLPFLTTDICKMHILQLWSNSKYNHLFLTWIGSTPQIHIGSPEYVEAVLNSDEPKCYDILKDWLEEGLLSSPTNEKWKKRRSVLSNVFHYGDIDYFMENFESLGKQLIEKINSSDGNSRKIVEIQKLSTSIELDSICQTVMGIETNRFKKEKSDYLNALVKMKSLLRKRLSNPLYFNKYIFQLTPTGREYNETLTALHNFTIDVINKNIATRSQHGNKNNTSKKNAITNLLELYDKGGIDINGIREEVDTLMFAGHDTVACALSWILYEIGRHQLIQENISDELREVSGKICSLEEKISQLKYMDCVIKECLRLHPPVFAIGRKLEKEMRVNGNTIPRGTIMMVDVFSVHRNPKYWKEPTVFNPDRFMNNEKRNVYSYIPFSIGKRNCLGQKLAIINIKVMLFSILSAFEIRSIQTPEELQVGIDILPHATSGIFIEFSKR